MSPATSHRRPFWADPVSVGELVPPAADVARLLLVRHGATGWNTEGRFQGDMDVRLNDAGHHQAARLAATLSPVEIDAAYTSPLSRARETAMVILAGRRVRAVGVPELSELRYGRCRGERRTDLLTKSPALLARWESSPWAVRFPGGESLDDVRRRVVPVWEQLGAMHRGDTVLVTAHGHVNRVLLSHSLDLPRGWFWDVPQPNGACVVVDVGAGGAVAALLAA